MRALGYQVRTIRPSTPKAKPSKQARATATKLTVSPPKGFEYNPLSSSFVPEPASPEEIVKARGAGDAAAVKAALDFEKNKARLRKEEIAKQLGLIQKRR
jgi:hypothetical protein